MNLRPYKLLMVFVSFTMFHTTIYAQQIEDSLANIEVVGRQKNKLDSSLHISVGGKQQNIVIDPISHSLATSVEKTLQLQQPYYIHIFGVNGMSTLQLRGSSAQQTQIVWQGIPINNAASGLTDLSLLSTYFVQELVVAPNANSGVHGSGAIGGVLKIKQGHGFGEKKINTSALLSAGSFGSKSIGGGLDFIKPKFYWRTKVFHTEQQNNFYYTNQFQEKTKFPNAVLKGSAVQTNMGLHLNQYHTVSGSLWYQQMDRGIPPAIFESNTTRHRQDDQLRSKLQWEYNRKRLKIQTTAAYLIDNNEYSDQQIGISLNYKVHNLYAMPSVEYKMLQKETSKSWRLSLSMPYQSSKLLSDTSTLGVQQRFAIVVHQYFRINKFQTHATLRQEWMDGKPQTIPALGIEYKTDKTGVGMQLQRTYRLPTLNELYFFPGGNPQLKPEQGWSGDLNFKYSTRLNKTFISIQPSLYYRQIQDWIIWYGGSIWTPHNVAKVRNLGIESNLEINRSLKNLNANLSIRPNYSLATTTESHVQNDGSIGKQIPNTPKYNMNTILELRWRRALFNINHLVTSLRYVTTDQSQFVDGYQIMNMGLGYELRLKVLSVALKGELQNVLNKEYQVSYGRPMPPRGILFTALIQATKKNRK